MKTATTTQPVDLALAAAASNLRSARAQHGAAVEADRLARAACHEISAEIREHEAHDRWSVAQACKDRTSALIAASAAAEEDRAAADALVREAETAAEAAARVAFAPYLMAVVSAVEGLKDAMDQHWVARRQISALGIRAKVFDRVMLPLPARAPWMVSWPKWARERFGLPPRVAADPATDADTQETESFGDAAIEPAAETATAAST